MPTFLQHQTRCMKEILYLHNAKVYIAASSTSPHHPQKPSRGSIRVSPNPNAHSSSCVSTSTISQPSKSRPEAFLRDNDRLDVVWNNAGVSIPPQRSDTKQKVWLAIRNRQRRAFLLRQVAVSHPCKSRKRLRPPDSARVVSLSPDGAEPLSPKGGVDLASNMDSQADKKRFCQVRHRQKSAIIFPCQRVHQATARRHLQSGMHSARTSMPPTTGSGRNADLSCTGSASQFDRERFNNATRPGIPRMLLVSTA